MDRYKAGMLARSLAGHDTGKMYVIMESDSAYVYLADGMLRSVDRPKRKKKKHVQPVCTRYEAAPLDEEEEPLDDIPAADPQPEAAAPAEAEDPADPQPLEGGEG